MSKVGVEAEEFTIREATPADVETIVAHRRGMFEAMGYADAAVLDAMQSAADGWTRTRLASGEYRGWLAVGRDGRVVAGAGLHLREQCSKPRNLSGRVAYVMNVFTEPGHRRRGLARRLMQLVLDWCRQNGYAEITLHASDAGRTLYNSLGFEPTNEMRLKLE